MTIDRSIKQSLAAMGGLLILGCTPPGGILPSALPNGVVGSPYSQTLAGDSQGSGQWQVSAGTLPPGLTLVSSTGMLTGIPSTAGTFEFTVSALVFSLIPGAGDQVYTLTIIPKLTLDATLEPARVNQPFSDTFTVTGGVTPYTFVVIGFPAGIALNTSSGSVSGTPLTAHAAIQLQVTVTDDGTPRQSVTQASFLTVKPPPVSLTTTSLPNGKLNQAYSAQLDATDGTTPYSWSLGPAVGVLPTGLRLNLNTGEIYETPTEAGSFTFTITVMDADSPETTSAREFTIEIQP